MNRYAVAVVMLILGMVGVFAAAILAGLDIINPGVAILLSVFSAIMLMGGVVEETSDSDKK